MVSWGSGEGESGGSPLGVVRADSTGCVLPDRSSELESQLCVGGAQLPSRHRFVRLHCDSGNDYKRRAAHLNGRYIGDVLVAQLFCDAVKLILAELAQPNVQSDFFAPFQESPEVVVRLELATVAAALLSWCFTPCHNVHPLVGGR